MPRRTRANASSSASAHASTPTNQTSANAENNTSSSTSGSSAQKTAARGRKRKSTEADSSDRPGRKKQARASGTADPEEVPDEECRPRLTTPDLEFDYDRSQLRDPRATPGRVKRPRREGGDLPAGFKQRFYVPEPEKPKGRLNAFQKDELFRQQAFLDPSETFHDLYVCHRKGRAGAPTYDSAGFRLDWKKVDEWMKPKPFSRSSAVKGMERALERHAREERVMYDIFFVDGKGPKAESSDVTNYMRDHVSKDLGIPWHQIGPKQLVKWGEKGFPKLKAEEWWQEPNEVEEQRMLKMLSGGSLRKDL
ncbi:hypothetical protein F4677DRAFT_315631 [Hypoxylon crocopeplum]|nr:hypothetical protein F4677DRAFT_315631 [Hypoxylon crocopeplum]